MVLMDLVKQYLRGVGISYSLDLFGQNLFAPGWKVYVEMNVGMYNTKGGRRCEFGKRNSCKEKVWTGCNYPCFLIPRVVSSD